MKAVSKEQMMQDMGQMLRELFEQRRRGVAMSRLARAHGYVDGCMRVMLDTGLVTKAELLALVGEQREASDGPALGLRDVA